MCRTSSAQSVRSGSSRPRCCPGLSRRLRSSSMPAWTRATRGGDSATRSMSRRSAASGSIVREPKRAVAYRRLRHPGVSLNFEHVCVYSLACRRSVLQCAVFSAWEKFLRVEWNRSGIAIRLTKKLCTRRAQRRRILGGRNTTWQRRRSPRLRPATTARMR